MVKILSQSNKRLWRKTRTFCVDKQTRVGLLLVKLISPIKTLYMEEGHHLTFICFQYYKLLEVEFSRKRRWIKFRLDNWLNLMVNAHQMSCLWYLLETIPTTVSVCHVAGQSAQRSSNTSSRFNGRCSHVTSERQSSAVKDKHVYQSQFRLQGQ